ncbi:hypothetical protein [Streptomyces spirodelae]|uniref:Conjugal transfer protein n=1 Tax=Streptomyces spirodelae TaxID=2812904 RepID=A0ABS3X1F9_9ACTN|nr:hypothetical protein [Streptomyces spirodelae]MBO8189215.1 hypothetical protein [Streptomyces spirodelae]
MTDTDPPAAKKLSTGQIWVLVAAAVPMVAFGVLGGAGTYSNIITVFHRSATALGVVAGGEGATLVLALVMVGLTMLGQSVPAAVRIGLWALPMVASGTGVAVARSATEAVVYAMTPMAMCVSAEGLGLLARRIVIYSTGVDMEARRRNAATVQKLAVQRALAAGHPEERARKKARKKVWRIAKKVGVGDTDLGATLVEVQRTRMTQGADTALESMFAPAVTAPGTPALPPGTCRDGDGTAGVTPAALERGADTATVTAPAHRNAPGTGGGTGAAWGVTQVNRPGGTAAVAPGGTLPVKGHTPGTGSCVTNTDAPEEASHGARAETLAGLAAVAGVPTPVTGVQLSDTQLAVVLRHMRHGEDPPRSYRQAVGCFRDEGFVGSEKRLRKTWGALMSEEEEATADTRDEGQEDEDSEQDDDAQEPHRP